MEVKKNRIRLIVFAVVLLSAFSCRSARDCDCPSFSLEVNKPADSNILVHA
jgi:hypothetical protein|tara:strand:+ start:709 stop:861 length:153 start_codon:yes stop_codon:yes gene_type:complete